MKYRKEIDGLRALAVIPVIFFHAGFEAFRGGFVGVDVFFVISGFLITSIIIGELKLEKFSFLNFYERRARRILPALMFMMFVCLPFAWFYMLPDDLENFSQSVFATITFSNNILLSITSGYFSPSVETKPLLHTWSLAVEEQYYIFFPLLMASLWKFGQKVTVLAIILLSILSLGFAEWSWRFNLSNEFYSTMARIWEILLGSIAAFYFHSKYFNQSKNNNLLCLLGFGLILYSIVTFGKTTPIPSVYLLFPVVGTLLLVLFCTKETFIYKILAWPPIVFMGLISYSAYLWHQPLFAFSRIFINKEPSTEIYLMLCVVTIIFAFLSWKYIEAPFRNKTVFNRKRIFQFSAIFSFLFVSLGLVGHFLKGAPDRLPKVVLAISSIKKMHTELIYYDGCTREGTEVDSSPCIYGDANSKQKIAIIGDSYGPGLKEALIKTDIVKESTIFQFTKVGCIPLSNLDPVQYSNNCSTYMESVNNQIKKLGIQTVILVARWNFFLNGSNFDNQEGGVDTDVNIPFMPADVKTWSTNDERKNQFIRVVTSSFNNMLHSEIKVILVYPIPELGWDLHHYLANALLQDIPISKDYGSIKQDLYKSFNQEIFEVFDNLGKFPNFVRIYPEKLLCDTLIERRCVAQINGEPLYWDNDHLTIKGNEFIVKAILPHLK